MEHKLLSAFSLCRRAGVLVFGLDAACKTAQQGKAAAVFITEDTGKSTAKKAHSACCGQCPVYEIPLSQQSVAAITGKPAGVLAVTHKDLAALCLSALAGGKGEEEPD